MSGTVAGGKKAAKTNRERYGKDFYVENGRKGGQNGHTGGFYSNPELARIAGAKGGRKSRRTGVKNGEGKKYQPEPKKQGVFSRLFGRKNG